MPSNSAVNHWFSEWVWRAIRRAEAADVNQSSLAHRWRIPEETLRAYRDSQSTPNATRLQQIISLSTDEDRLDLATVLMPQLAVSLRPYGGDDGAVKPKDALRKLIDANRGLASLLENADRHSSDGILSREEVTELVLLRGAVVRALDEFLSIVNRCAARGGAR